MLQPTLGCNKIVKFEKLKFWNFLEKMQNFENFELGLRLFCWEIDPCAENEMF